MTALHSGDVAGPAYENHHHIQYRRLAVALLLVTSSLAACSDNSPVAPASDTPNATSMNPVLVSVVDDATTRLLAELPSDSPVQTAFGALRSALASHDTPAALRAVGDARLALDFSQAAHSIDAADRDALALQLSVVERTMVQAQLAPEAR